MADDSVATPAPIDSPTRRRFDVSDGRGGWIALAIILGLLVADAVTTYLFSGRQGDFVHFYDAANGVLRGENIYTFELLETELNWYAYLPLFAVVVASVAWMPFAQAGAAWSVINGALLAGMFAMTGRAVTRALEPDGIVRRRITPAAGWIALVALVLMADKVRTQLRLGQSDAFITFWIVLAYIWKDRRPILCGFALGMATNVKLQGLIFLPYLLARRRWAAAASTAVSSVAIALSGALIWGWERNSTYLATSLGWVGGLLGVHERTETNDLNPLEWFRSISIPSIAERFRLAMDWPMQTTMLMSAAAALTLLAIGWWMYTARGTKLMWRGAPDERRDPAGRLVSLMEWAGMIVAAMAFSPQNTARHYLPVILVVAVSAGLALDRRTGRCGQLAIGVSMVAFVLAMVLPPGGEAFAGALQAWRAVGGQLWALLVMFFVTLWFGLGRAADMRAEHAGSASDAVTGASRSTAPGST